ncbi:MAG: DUF1700 domain-containing protein, partial [Ruminiclostridium sp.]|nr:DUF1700 domain-containing protein [Ruminiclostridium sp.]
MNKIEFLSRLRIALAPLPEDERDAAMVYYEEFFDDAGVENEQSVIAEFGSPEELAKSIVEENNRDNPAYNQVSENGDYGQNNINTPGQNSGNVFNNENTAYNNGGYNTNGGGINPPPVQQNGKWSNGQIALVIVLLVISSPIWLGVLAGILGMIVGLFGVLIGIIVALGCCAIAFLVGGVLSAIKEPAVGILMIGMSFVCAG